MKRFMKGCAVTALIFAVLGSALTFVGSRVAGKATVEQIVENVTGGTIHVDPFRWWSRHIGEDYGAMDMGIADSAVTEEDDYGYMGNEEVGDGYGEEGPVEFVNEYEITRGNVDKFCPGEDIRRLELDLGSCALGVEPSGDGYLYLEAENAYKFQSYLKGNTLHVKAAGKSASNWTDTGDCQVTLYVPEGYRFDKVEAKLGAGYVALGDLYAEEISLEVGAGEVDINYADASKMDISVGAGSVVVSGMDVDQLEGEVGMGSFQAEGAVHRKADIECSMGYVVLYLDGAESDFNYQLDGSMGYIEIGGKDYAGLAQEMEINNKASKDIEVECSMGNISILFMD